MTLNSVIAAISTPPGKGGVAVIRVSGDAALDIASRVFIPKSGRPLKDSPVRMQIYGNIVYGGEEIDDGLATCFKAPHSYTGEDTVEISCHGGALVTRTVLEALFAAGARPAEAGEFTRRAVMNGKISLTEAEAVGNLLEAKTHAQILLNTERSRGQLAKEIEAIRASLVELLSSMYARIDYPDEDLGDFSDAELSARLSTAEASVARLIASYKTGRAVSEGIESVICGRTNAGKSTLYNLLVGDEAAIVTDISGTTRDVLTSEIPLGKLLLRLSDTAGVRDGSDDKIELIGIERSLKKIDEAELILAVFDASCDATEDDLEIIRRIEPSSAAKIAMLNKCDCDKLFDTGLLEGKFDRILELSAKCGGAEARLAISEATDTLFTDEKIEIGTDATVSSARQNAKLMSSIELIRSARAAIDSGLPQDIASSDIERALAEIAELDGRAVSEEVLGDIFSRFCVGK